MRLLKNTGLESNSDGCASVVWDHVPSVFSLVPALTSCHVCEWITLILLFLSLLPHLFLLPSPLPMVLLTVLWLSSALWLTDVCIHSFILWENTWELDHIDLMDSSPPFIFTVPPNPFCLDYSSYVYISLHPPRVSLFYGRKIGSLTGFPVSFSQKHQFLNSLFKFKKNNNKKKVNSEYRHSSAHLRFQLNFRLKW